MHLERSHPSSIDDLLRLVEEASGCGPSIVAQAGHFLLYFDEQLNQAKPCIADPDFPQQNDTLENYGHFPLLTWSLGLEMLSQSRCFEKEVLLLVNDWQYLPQAVNRSEFYSNNPELPAVFRATLSEHASVRLLRPNTIGEESVTGPFFGEMHLRNRYKKRIARMIREQTLPPDVVLDSSGGHLTCSMPLSGGPPAEIYCSGKSADCTAEVAELLLQISASRPQAVFLNIYPIVCRDFVQKGTLLAKRLGVFNLARVINIGFPSSGVFTTESLVTGCEVAVHSFT